MAQLHTFYLPHRIFVYAQLVKLFCAVGCSLRLRFALHDTRPMTHNRRVYYPSSRFGDRSP
ncbi:hypothetical protein BDU57DRAFT_515842 [Ampelomyces quisqualis]|uniref:Uncharacterized protein n=1 Tax=Ampelomyces quisqualis TaxID=50730 RepID=A0A6A5QKV2_AMPQU|nr:hypothetical protein BDU57DRAFT_515842 [Ampelomyces quisqualis]